MKRSVWMGVGLVLLLGAITVGFLLRSGGGPEGPAALVPGDARAYLQIDSLPEAVGAAETIVSRLGFGMMIKGTRRGIDRQLGFDPFDRAALLERGIDPDRPLAGYLPGATEELVVLFPVADQPKAQSTLEQLWQDRMGGTVEAADLEGVAYHRALDPQGAVGSAWAYREGYLIVATGTAAPERLKPVLHPGGAPRLAQQPRFTAAWSALGDTAHLFAWALPEGAARADRRLKAVEEGLDAGAFSLHLEENSVEVGLFGDLGAVAATALPVFAPVDAASVDGLLDRLYPEAVVAARFSLSFPETWKQVARAPGATAAAGLEDQLRARGVELSEVLQAFDGQIVGGLSPLSDLELSRMPALDLRRTNPFRYFRAEVRAGLRDPAMIKKLLPTVAEALSPALRAEISRSEIDGVEAFTLRYHLGEGMTFGIIGTDLVATGGEGAFAAAVARAKAKTPGFGSSVKGAPFADALAHQGSLGAVLQVGRLLEALGEVTSERLGGGPGGMAGALAFRKMRSTLAKIDHLSAILVPGKSALEAHVALELVPGPKKAESPTP